MIIRLAEFPLRNPPELVREMLVMLSMPRLKVSAEAAERLRSFPIDIIPIEAPFPQRFENDEWKQRFVERSPSDRFAAVWRTT